jgi:glutaredoxin
MMAPHIGESRALSWRVHAAVLVAVLFLLLANAAPAQAPQRVGPARAGAPCNEIILFHREGCPHCERAHAFLDDLQRENPKLVIVRLDVERDPQARARFFELSEENGITRPGVPAFLICDQFTVGFDRAETTGEMIRMQLGDSVSAAERFDELARGRFSGLSVESLGLPLFTILIGLVDGFNPCAMWVLTFLLSVLVGIGNRRKMVLIAGTFVLVSGLMYFAFMAAWLNAFLLVGYSRLLQVILGGLAALIGMVHIKDFFAFKRGITLSIPEGAKPTLFVRMRRVVTAEKVGASVLGVALLAILVNVVELLCTAGLPAVFTQILTLRNLSTLEYYGYLVLYNVAYVFDDALMVAAAVFTLTRWKMQERHGRWLKLVSGLVICVLGAMLVFAPQWLV